jgi:ubiquinone/menaquinone biosynthesis C-methylase UbiE
MFWDQVAGVYDIFVNVINRKTHQKLKEIVSDLIGEQDSVLECACGTGFLSAVIAQKCRKLTATDYSLKMQKKFTENIF